MVHENSHQTDHDAIRIQGLALMQDFGLPIIPVCSHDHNKMSVSHTLKCTSPGKSPCLKGWTKGDLEPIDLDDTFKTNHDLNIGLVLGDTPHHNILGIDVDGAEGYKLWEGILQEHEELPKTWSFTTGSGGLRLLFSMPVNFKSQKNNIKIDGEHQEVSFIASGQMTVIPPSIHPSGNKYFWNVPPWECEIAQAPQWMLDLVEQKETKGCSSSKHTLVISDEPVQQGQRNDTMAREVMSLCAKLYVNGRDAAFGAAMSLANNPKKFNPPLTEEEVIKAFDGAWYKISEKKHDAFIKEQKKIELQPVELGKSFIKHQLTKGQHYRFRNDRLIFMKAYESHGPWKVLSNKELLDDLYSYIYVEHGPRLASLSSLERILDSLTVSLVNDIEVGNKEFGEVIDNPFIKQYYNSESMVVKNGVYYWKEDKIQAWNPLENYHGYGFNFEYDPTETYQEYRDKWEEHLTSWIPDLAMRKYIQEYIGYCLTPDCSQRCMTFLLGGGRNGKSMFIETITSLFGSAAEEYSLNDTQDKFNKVQFVDKLLLYNHDMSKVFLKETGVLKSAIAGEPLKVEEKFKAPFTYRPICKFLVSLNEMPTTADNTIGFYDRINIIRFPNSFEVDAKFKKLLDIEFINNAEGKAAIFSWAMEGLRRLNANNGFTQSVTMEEEKTEYKISTDSILQFCTDVLEPHPLAKDDSLPLHKKSIFISDLIEVYEIWCSKTGEIKRSTRTFKKELKRLGYDIRQIYQSQYKRPYGIYGVKFKDSLEEYSISIKIKNSI